MRVYKENPKSSKEFSIVEGPKISKNKTLDSALIRVRSCLYVGEKNSAGCVLKQVAKADKEGNFLYLPQKINSKGGNPFAEVSAYFHAHRALKYFESLGIPRGQLIRNPPLELVVDAKLPESSRPTLSTPRAFFAAKEDPSGRGVREYHLVNGGLIWLGFGNTHNTAYDADVVVHEMCHAIFDRGNFDTWQLTPTGSSLESQAVDEALADYFTAVITKSPKLGEYLGGRRQRDLRGARRYTPPTGNASHDGVQLARTLWAARKKLSKKMAVSFDKSLAYIRRGKDVNSVEAFANEVLHELKKESKEMHRVARNSFLESELLLETIHRIVIDSKTSNVSANSIYVVPGTGDLKIDGVAPATVQYELALPTKARLLRGSLRIIKLNNQPWSEETKGRVGRMEVLVSWDSELTWPLKKETKTQMLPVSENGVFGVSIPSGAKRATFQVVNRGSIKNSYKSFGVSVDRTF